MWTLSPSSAADLSAEACLLQLQRSRSWKWSTFTTFCIPGIGQLWASLPVVWVECDIIPVNSDAGLEDFLDVFVPRPFQFWVTWLMIWETQCIDNNWIIVFGSPWFRWLLVSMSLLLEVVKPSKQESLWLSERICQSGIDTDLNKKLFDQNLAPLPRSSFVNGTAT